MLECLELLDSESRYRNDCKAAEDKIAEIYEEEDRQAREEEKKILNKHIEEMVETFEVSIIQMLFTLELFSHRHHVHS